jgi:hypothetical protein
VIVGRHQDVEGVAGLDKQGSAWLEYRLLLQQCCPRAGMKTHFTHVRLVVAGQDAEQCRFAYPVRSDQANALSGVELEADLLEQRPFIETPG